MQENDVINSNETNQDNSQSIHNLIESIQTKLNKENESNNSDTNEDTQSNNESKEKSNLEPSALGSLLKNIDISQLLGGFSSEKNQKNDNNSSFNLGDIDPTLILKFQKILSSMKKDDPKKDLLLSLKPFLRKSRQDKLNEYVTMLTIANAIGIFGSKGSD